MIRPPVFYGKVLSSKVVLDNPERWRNYMKTFEGKRVELVLREKRTTRSNAQNAYYHSVIVDMLAEYTGHDHDEMHEALKKQFNIQSTAKLKTQEFEDYISRIKIWASEFHGVYLPDPGSVDY
jgi:hypothetical protein